MYAPVYKNEGKAKTATIKMAKNRNLRLPIFDQSSFSIDVKLNSILNPLVDDLGKGDLGRFFLTVIGAGLDLPPILLTFHGG